MQGRDGNWYIYKEDKTLTMQTSKKKQGEQGGRGKFTKQECVIIGLAAAFGVSFASLIVVLIS